MVLVEGEKAFDAFAAYGSKSYTAAHWVGGRGSVGHADYSPLRDRDVILWPDADNDGREMMAMAAVKAKGAGAASLAMVDVSDLPERADAADVDAQTIRELLDGAGEWTPPPTVHPSNEALSKGAFFTRDAEGLEAALLTLRLELRSNVRGGRIEVHRLDHGSQEAFSFEVALGLEPDPSGWAHFSENAAAWCLNHSPATTRIHRGSGTSSPKKRFAVLSWP